MADWDVPFRHADLAIADQMSVLAAPTLTRPSIVINSAPSVRVDETGIRVEQAFRFNTITVQSFAQPCAEHDPLVCLSTGCAIDVSLQ